MTDVYETILNWISVRHGFPSEGETMLAIWKNYTHLEEWINTMVTKSEDIKVIIVPTFFLPIKTSRPEARVVGIALGIASDYSDIMLLYHMEVTDCVKKEF